MLQLPVYNANSEFLWCVILQVDTKQMFFYKILKLYIVKPFNNVFGFVCNFLLHLSWMSIHDAVGEPQRSKI